MGGNQKTLLVAIFNLFITVKASPFELTDAYIANFKAGIDDLKGLSHSYNYLQTDYGSDAENGTETVTG